ncbi:hypothetical protein FA13DRAFT_1474051 [Coprinellus micaceus]|uniref:Uncharacterized protein n=1 Tax=Coprinellus micaceus TaxID=71717 RepID=A0A4Y7SLD0_COPMI|nr:hypothetical protein FA13DRAFT_1474051 [Coprinellus micaceus]
MRRLGPSLSHRRTPQITHSSAQDGILIVSRYSLGRQHPRRNPLRRPGALRKTRWPHHLPVTAHLLTSKIAPPPIGPQASPARPTPSFRTRSFHLAPPHGLYRPPRGVGRSKDTHHPKRRSSARSRTLWSITIALNPPTCRIASLHYPLAPSPPLSN